MHPAIAIIALCFFFAGCGQRGSDETAAVAYANEPESPDWLASSRAYEAASPDASELEADLHGLYVVAPDRALVRIAVGADGVSRAQVAERLRGRAAALETALEDSGACSAEVIDYGAVARVGERWRGAATLRYDISLAGLDSVYERYARLESCMRRIGGAAPSLRGATVSVSEARLTIDDPASHRGALLQRELDARREIAAFAEAPGALAPRRCTTDGQVSITRRSLRGIALSLEMRCAGGVSPGAS